MHAVQQPQPKQPQPHQQQQQQAGIVATGPQPTEFPRALSVPAIHRRLGDLKGPVGNQTGPRLTPGH